MDLPNTEKGTEFQQDFIELMRKHFPGIQVDDTDQTSALLAELAVSMGALLGRLVLYSGEQAMREVFKLQLAPVVLKVAVEYGAAYAKDRQ